MAGGFILNLKRCTARMVGLVRDKFPCMVALLVSAESSAKSLGKERIASFSTSFYCY